MRAGRALLAFAVACGAAGSLPRLAEASTTAQARNQPQMSTQARPAPQRQAARPAAQQARPQPARTTAQATPRLPPRAPIGPQEQAQAALLTPVVAPAGLNIGTPIRPVAQTGGLSCVPYVRLATGMDIRGDARFWWHNAAGTYARGNIPERGAVIAFMASGGMSRGHVGVVSRVVNARTILIDHSNWAGPGIRRGQVMRGVAVVDVSDRNDWTAVRVQVGHSAESFGRTYPVYGFIYNRPVGERILTAEAPAGMVELAEASPHAVQHLRLAAEVLGR